ncbi:proteasome core particle subunit alpha 5 [Sugiyamaella lignohabitans]|uniref:Proteasome core particle subunit alpha 5 n=1 Tax=Sugiyamaella lignohabitans TaxID=796027 RepID=A0A167DM95_9ASCO|nr:proteasome core particle subunit alpha 5 [Sugiyamaella lignohabitans]ANB13064.1 proteasome core particle subunit alpha 5 [Sugiyamaella lignohabitans]
MEEAELLVLKVLKQVMEEKLDSKNAQLSSVTKEHGFKIYNDQEMAAVVEKLEAQAGPDETATATATDPLE